MTPKQKILAIRLSEKLSKNPEYAKYLGIEIKNEHIQEGIIKK